MQRREWMIRSAAAAGVLAGMVGCATGRGAPAKAQVLVVGGGYGGATAARYIRLFSRNTVDVVLVEPNRSFVSCPISNLVVGGVRTLADITTSYDALRDRHGITVVHDTVTAVDRGPAIDLTDPHDDGTRYTLHTCPERPPRVYRGVVGVTSWKGRGS